MLLKGVITCFTRLIIWFDLVCFYAIFVVIVFKNAVGGSFYCSFYYFSSVFVFVCPDTSYKNKFFLVLPFSLNFPKISFWCLMYAAMMINKFFNNRDARVSDIISPSDFKYNTIFKTSKSKCQKYATLLLFWPSNINNFSINLIISSKEIFFFLLWFLICWCLFYDCS